MSRYSIRIAILGFCILTPEVLLAGQGWYLVTPPMVKSPSGGTPTFNMKAPLSRWDSQSAFDTARECEDFKAQAISLYKEQSINKPTAKERSESIFAHEATVRAICVASDDRRLTK